MREMSLCINLNANMYMCLSICLSIYTGVCVCECVRVVYGAPHCLHRLTEVIWMPRIIPNANIAPFSFVIFILPTIVCSHCQSE